MKKLVKYIVLVAATMFAVGCTPDYPTIDQDSLPLASELDVEIVADQTTNLVTFTLKNQGMTPMWIFGENRPDDPAVKKDTFAVTVNGYTARFRDAGTYSVEVKAYNASGVSQGSVVKEFTLENTYRDPFDATKYFNAVSNNSSLTWQWNSEVAGHFGCGDSIGNPTGWWPCDANGKAGVGLYDDRLTFSADGKYTFNPGDDGSLYVNHDVSALPGTDPSLTDDYAITVEEQTWEYRFEQVWNEQGIEEIWLVLDEGANLSYVPHDEALSNPRYLVIENSVATMKKKLSLVWYTPTGNGGGPIAWKYEFIPEVKVVTPEEMLAGAGAEGKVWVMDSNTPGHLGCGESIENPAGWWSAPANDKAAYGLYDDEITFYPDGKYVYSSGADGLMYINWGVTVIGPNPGVEPDIDIEWPLTESTYTFVNNTITLAPETPMVYVPSDHVWANPVFHVTELTEYTMTVVADNPGCYWQMKFRARDVEAPAVTFGGENIAAGPVELTIAQGEQIAVSGVNFDEIWIDPDFFEVVDANNLKFLAVDGDYRVAFDGKWFKVIPLESGDKATYDAGKALWMIGDGGGKPEGALIGWNTGEAPLPMARISDNQYRITLWMKAEGGSVKVFGQSDWGVEWTQDKYGTVTDNGFFHIPGADGNIHTVEGATAGFYTFYFTDNGGILDMEVKKFATKPTSLDPAAASNLWKGGYNVTYWFADNNWSQIADPTVVEDGANYKVTLTEGMGASQWQGQMAIMTDINIEEGKNYDFQVKLYSEVNQPTVTVKLCNGLEGAADSPFFFDPKVSIVEYEETTVLYWNFAGQTCTPAKLVLDFGGCVPGSVIEVRDLVLQEHVE